MGDFNFRTDTQANEQTPEGILRAILAEVRGLREDLKRQSGAGLFVMGEAGPEIEVTGAARERGA